MNKFPYNIDIAVLIIFFCRDEQFQKVFQEVKKARPSKLYLYQDGPRSNNQKDIDGIKKCRVIAEDIDWECEVHRFYQEKNYGCDPSEYIAQKWMFESEEMGIVLEDDDVPAQSFFSYCKILLERYQNNDQINIICGMNNSEISTHISCDYLFTKKGSIWGWATWKRVVDKWDETYSWIDDKEKLNIIKNQFNTHREFREFLTTAIEHKKTGTPHYESILAASLYLNDGLNIVPKYNMISNIGISDETTHSVDNINKLPKRVRKLLYMKTYEIKFPLKHPTEITRDIYFEQKMTANRIQLMLDFFETIFLRLKFRDFSGLTKAIKRRIKCYLKF